MKTFAEAASFGDVVVLAVAGQVALEALTLVGPKALRGKTVIDACNPIGGGPPVHGVLSYFTTLTDLLMERLQNAYPEAHFVKAFNSVGNAQMVNPHFAGGRPTMFICGNDANAKRAVAQILDQFGGISEDMGAVEAARAIEPLHALVHSGRTARATGRRTRSSCCDSRRGNVCRRTRENPSKRPAQEGPAQKKKPPGGRLPFPLSAAYSAADFERSLRGGGSMAGAASGKAVGASEALRLLRQDQRVAH